MPIEGCQSPPGGTFALELLDARVKHEAKEEPAQQEEARRVAHTQHDTNDAKLEDHAIPLEPEKGLSHLVAGEVEEVQHGKGNPGARSRQEHHEAGEHGAREADELHSVDWREGGT